MADTIVLGIGNAERGDDGAGRLVVTLLRGTLPATVEIAELEGEATALLTAFAGAQSVYIADACLSGAAPGTVHRFDARKSPLPEAFSDVSTHGFGVAAAIELARSLGQLPPAIVVYAIEGGSFAIGAPLSDAVCIAAGEVADRIRDEIAAQDRG